MNPSGKPLMNPSCNSLEDVTQNCLFVGLGLMKERGLGGPTESNRDHTLLQLLSQGERFSIEVRLLTRALPLEILLVLNP
jgi:hypothetical protein